MNSAKHDTVSTDSDVAIAFVEAINNRDMGLLTQLMANDISHTLIDYSCAGKDDCISYWQKVFGRFPSFQMQITDVVPNIDRVLLLGTPKTVLDVPCVWEVILRNGLVCQWNEIPNCDDIFHSNV